MLEPTPKLTAEVSMALVMAAPKGGVAEGGAYKIAKPSDERTWSNMIEYLGLQRTYNFCGGVKLESALTTARGCLALCDQSRTSNSIEHNQSSNTTQSALRKRTVWPSCLPPHHTLSTHHRTLKSVYSLQRAVNTSMVAAWFLKRKSASKQRTRRYNEPSFTCQGMT